VGFVTKDDLSGRRGRGWRPRTTQAIRDPGVLRGSKLGRDGGSPSRSRSLVRADAEGGARRAAARARGRRSGSASGVLKPTRGGLLGNKLELGRTVGWCATYRGLTGPERAADDGVGGFAWGSADATAAIVPSACCAPRLGITARRSSTPAAVSALTRTAAPQWEYRCSIGGPTDLRASTTMPPASR